MMNKQISIVFIFTAVVAIIHWFIPEQYLVLHTIFRTLYFIPIIYMALVRGRKAGLISALIISVLLLPHFFITSASSEFIAGNAVAIVLFNLCGFFFGSFRESSKTNLTERLLQKQNVPYRHNEHQRVLFYVDETPLSLSAAEWFGNRFDVSKMSLVLLTVSNMNREEIAADKLNGKIDPEQAQPLKPLFDIKKAFVESGMKDDDIETITTTITQRIPISDKIIQHSKEQEFDMIVLCKHNKKKSEEFLFGDTAIQLLRKTTIPLLVVKGAEEQLVHA
jgi:nucleotide-binding universal stress UspA family protein